ncbi:MAG: cytochrome b/b6 domain-containing protein [Sphingomonadales bacterium]|nr:cytochrome b/b6 domain-containing protein [Sphingomonadales bacterium]MDE2168763.1 cytochrome b/b6 domain-containing protein [Sphingomonadales bacterium]
MVSSTSDTVERASAAPQGGQLVRRHSLPVRLWHWLNALSVFILLMSGLMIFNAHPQLYWGQFGANPDHHWLAIFPGHLQIGSLMIPTHGIIAGVTPANGRSVAFAPWLTIPSHYDLADSRKWHFLFAWVLVVPGICFWTWGFARHHFRRDLAPSLQELSPRHLLQDIADHARLRFPTGSAALRFNILQKLAYCGVLFLLLPGAILTGLTMSPGMDAAWPWLLDLFGGRASARSIHFICAMGIALFILVHLVMVVLAGPFNEIRSMITGRYRLPREKGE